MGQAGFQGVAQVERSCPAAPSHTSPVGTTDLFNGHQQCRCFRQGTFNTQEDRFFRNGNLSLTFYMWCGACGYCLMARVGVQQMQRCSHASRLLPRL